MPSAFSQKDIKSIGIIIRNWPITEKLTWDAICDASQSTLGFKPTRQALSSKPLLANAYKTKRQEIISDRSRKEHRILPKSLSDAAEQIYRLKEENERLKEEISNLADAARAFIHNATQHNITREQLSKPVPKPNRR